MADNNDVISGDTVQLIKTLSSAVTAFLHYISISLTREASSNGCRQQNSHNNGQDKAQAACDWFASGCKLNAVRAGRRTSHATERWLTVAEEASKRCNWDVDQGANFGCWKRLWRRAKSRNMVAGTGCVCAQARQDVGECTHMQLGYCVKPSQGTVACDQPDLPSTRLPGVFVRAPGSGTSAAEPRSECVTAPRLALNIVSSFPSLQAVWSDTRAAMIEYKCDVRLHSA